MKKRIRIKKEKKRIKKLTRFCEMAKLRYEIAKIEFALFQLIMWESLKQKALSESLKKEI